LIGSVEAGSVGASVAGDSVAGASVAGAWVAGAWVAGTAVGVEAGAQAARIKENPNRMELIFKVIPCLLFILPPNSKIGFDTDKFFIHYADHAPFSGMEHA
jgi:hypothetical protein